jgi:hypothetical protein
VQDLPLSTNKKVSYIETNLAQELMVKINNKNMLKVGNKVSKKWTLANAVKKFAPHQLDSLKKNKGNLNSRQFDSLIKEMKCYYDEVEPVGKGKDRIIYTDKKRKEKVKKEDRRQFNKGVAPPHSKHLALMVMSKMNSIDYKARTRNGWAGYFGVISPAEKDILKGIYSEEALKPYKEYLIGLEIIEDGEGQIFQDLANTLKNVVTGHLQTVLDQAEELNLIRIISSWKGKVKNSREQLDIDNDIAKEINNTEAESLKKHGINKWEALNLKNSPKTKAYNAEWLEYIENVVDAEGDAMQLQYIYEVFHIQVLNKYALIEFIKVHYPSETDSFNLLENEQLYHSNLLDYVVRNAQKKHDNHLMKKQGNKGQSDEAMIELIIGLGFSEEEASAFVREQEDEVYLNEKEPSPYVALLESDKYVDCIRNIHIQLHSISEIDSSEIKAVQHMKDEQEREELERLGLTNRAELENEQSVKNQILINEESSFHSIEEEELTKREQSKQANEPAKEIELENIEEKRVSTVAESNFPHTNHIDELLDEEYLAAMEEIRNEFREYEVKHGDKAVEYIRLDSVIRMLVGEGEERRIAEFKQNLQRRKEIEKEEWDKLFEGGQHVELKQTTNNPLEQFYRIRNGRNDREDS